MSFKKGKNHYGWKGGKPSCVDCGKKIAHKAKRCKSCDARYRILSSNHIFHTQKRISGKKHPSYIDGRTNKSVYCIDLCVHYIDYDKLNYNKNNLITLCSHCHTRTNFNRDYWKNYFSKEMKNVVY